MKQKSRFLAFLLALGLLASLAVTPAAAASLSELQSAVDTAQAELTDAQTALDNAKDAFDSAKAAVKDAEDAVDEANRAVGEKDTALENLKRRAEEATEEAERTELEAQIPAAETALEQAKTEAANKKAALDAVKNQVGLEEKQTAFELAEKTVEEKQKKLNDAKAALEEEKNNQANQNPPAVPTGSDLSWPSSVDFGKLGKGTTSDLTRTFTITNRTSYDMVLSASSVSGYTISGASGTLAANSSTTVTVRLDSTSRTGRYNGTLTVNASFVNGTGG